MSKKIRWGILSTANIAAKAVMPAINESNNGEIVALASSNDERRQVLVDVFNIEKQYSSYEGLLEDQSIDAVYIPLPNSLHKEWVIKAAQAGKHILCEKPAALTADDTKEMVEVCREQGVLFMEAFMYQFHPQHTQVKNIIASGDIGEIKLMRSSFSFNIGENASDNIRLNKELGGGCLFDVGCYSIHAIRHILDTEPTEVYVIGHEDPEFQVEMSAHGIMTLENGVQAMFDSSFESQMRNTYEIVGSTGSIVVENAYRPDKEPGGEGRILITAADGTTREIYEYGNPYVLEVEHFADCVLNGTPLSYTPENTIQNMKVIEACYESLEKHKPIILD